MHGPINDLLYLSPRLRTANDFQMNFKFKNLEGQGGAESQELLLILTVLHNVTLE